MVSSTCLASLSISPREKRFHIQSIKVPPPFFSRTGKIRSTTHRLGSSLSRNLLAARHTVRFPPKATSPRIRLCDSCPQLHFRSLGNVRHLRHGPNLESMVLHHADRKADLAFGERQSI